MDETRIDLTRTVELLDELVVRTEGDAREIDAYAAVFNTPAEIRDFEGHYWETIDPGAFDRTVAQRASKVRVMFNHGRDIVGMPSERFALPIGTPVEIKPDGRGLFTRTRVAKTPLGDEVLELARSGAITGFSFKAAAVQTKRHPRGADGLPTFERTEFKLMEYGPGIFTYYDDAEILAVRAEFLANHLTDEERAQLLRALAGTPDGSPHGPADPAATGHSGPTTTWRDEAIRAVRQFEIKGT